MRQRSLSQARSIRSGNAPSTRASNGLRARLNKIEEASRQGVAPH